jgi:uncharacterized membrane protein
MTDRPDAAGPEPESGPAESSEEQFEEVALDEAVYERHAPGLEFDRVAFFSDAVFAIAMTLLVVGIGIPHVSDGHLEDALGDKGLEVFSFFLSFVVIGFYWLSHHRFFALLQRVDRRFMELNLLFLAAIAFMPFPTALVGSYGNETSPVVLYAVTLATASLLDALLMWRAHVKHLMRRRMPDDVFRWAMLASVAPVVVFLVSIPVAFAAAPSWALYTWILIFPIEMLLDRFLKPVEAERALRPRN